ncbi:hypothetical protein ACQ4PT_062223 [Festuca glaucescens]
MFAVDTGEVNRARARRAQELQQEAEARDRRLVACSKKEKKKKKKMAKARRAQAHLSGKKEAEMHMSEEVFWTGEAFGGSGPVTKSSRVKKAAASGTKAPSTPIPRPQDVYHIVVDNTNKPFEHALLEKSPDGGARPTHPLEKLPVEQLFDRRVPESPPLKPPELSDTPFTFVQDRKTLNKLVRKLKNATEFAVNVEYNHFRSFQGLTCLMQISTRTEDFIVDTLKLCKYLGERLREAFQDPTKKKVMYGATRDIMWLQRDFGIYICNLFDIGQLKLDLLTANRLQESYRWAICQRADWRQRPLPDRMTKCAREVTHYLLYIYDLMRLRLMNESSGENDLLLEVCKCSNEICLQLYEKEPPTDKSYLHIHGLKENELSARQLAVLALVVFNHRVCINGEIVLLVLRMRALLIYYPTRLLEIAKQIPVTARRFKRTVEAKNKFLDHHLGHVITIIRNAVANSDSFENIAEQLKKERLEELMVADTKSSSEDTETITAVDADNNESNSHSSDEPALVPGFSSEQGHVPKAPFFTLIVDGSLDCSAICGTLKKVLKWMGFDQLTMFIMYKIIPFMESCPEELRPKLVDEILEPVFHYLHTKLYKSWCVLLHDGAVEVPDKIADIFLSKEEANKLGSSLIIQLTRAASELLAVIACPQLNGSSEFVCSRSLVGYVLCHDVLRLQVLSLIDYIFGAWNVDEAKMTLVPLCYKVIEVATATRHDAIISFVKDMIPHLIQWLAFKSSLEGTQPGDVIIKNLCHQAFRCVHYPNQDLACEEKHKDRIYEVFQSWLEQKKLVVGRRKKPMHELEEFVWIWEVEEEFSKYIPGYIDMLHQVNEMDDCLERDSSSPRVLFEKLDPKFVSKYAIDSPSHDYLWAMSAMVKRKMSAMHWQRRNDKMFQFLCLLIDFKPYIQHSSYDDSVVELVEESKAYPDLAEFLRADALEVFCAILLLWEPQFHPMIRKEHKDVLKKILHHVTSLENITFLQPLLPDVRDFPVRLRPYAKNYIDNRNKEYIVAKEQARLHEQFDAHLASGVLDHYLSKGDAGSHGDALKAVLNDSRQFSALDHDLIKLSFERRAELLGRRDQLHLFYKCFQRVTRDAQLRIEVQSLIDQLGRQDFFCIDDDAIDWDQKCCSELVDKFNKQVFTGSDLPKYYVIRGIMDYQAMSRMKDGSCSWCDVFQKVVGKPYDRWIQNIPSFWMDTRYYKHQYYDIIQQPLQKIWKKEE